MDSLGSDLDLFAPHDVYPDLHHLDNCWPRRQQLQAPSEALNEDKELTNIAKNLILEMRDNLNDVVRYLNLNQTKSEGHKNKQTNTNINSIKTNQTTTEIEHQEDQGDIGESEMLNDDEALVAWFNDASSDFNNEPTTRCYVNKLYQPMNASAHDQHQLDDGSTLVEQEDEYLLLCEEINRLERADERQQVQLPKILDDDDDPIVQHDHHQHEDSHEDPLDRLQLTTIIESFDSFPSSPLIGSCHGRDPLISDACHRQDKPDSTKSVEMSPSDSNNLNSQHHLHSQHQHNQQQYDCHQQFELSQKLQDDQDSHFLSSISSENLLNNDSQCYHQHQRVLKDHHQHIATQRQDQQQQQHEDASSEISCFQQVSTTYMQPALMASSSSEMVSPVPLLSPYNNSILSPSLTIEQIQTNGDGNKKESPEGRQVRKRFSQQSKNVHRSEAEETDTRVNSVKKRKSKDLTNEIESNSQLHDVSSTLTNNAKIKTKNQNTSKTTNKHLQEHIITNSGTPIVHVEEADDHSAMEDEDCNSTGSDSQPQMTKYRRRTANARERIRMREINQAFERLKKVVPLELIHTVSGDESDASTSRRGSSKSGQQHSDLQSPVKLTKITTLRLAVSYIAKLSEVLSQHPEGCPMTIPSSELASNSEANSQNEKELRSSPASKGGVTRKRRSRTNSSKSKKVFDESLVKKVKHSEPFEVAEMKTGVTDDRGISPDKKPEKAYLLTQSKNQNRQILFTSNMIQQHQHQQHNHNTFNHPQQVSRQPQQFAYVNYQQPLTISQTTNNNNNNGQQQQQNRTLVTPVAVAILGIQTAGNNQGLGEGQPLQILGIQQAGAAQQLHQRPASQQLQQASIPYSLIAQQPQQVTFTLGHDMNGMSVLRLAQPSQDGQAQFQQNRPIMSQQPQMLATTTASGYNYTAYQPIQISQLQTTSSSTTTAQMNNSSTTLVQNQRGSSALHFRGGEINSVSNNLGVGGNNTNGTLATTTTTATSSGQQQQHQSLVAMTTMPITTTGNNKSDCNNFGISPTIIAQHLNGNNNVVQATQINFHQQSSDCSNQQTLPGNLVTMTPSNQHKIFQATTKTANHVVATTPNNGQNQTANIIYLNPTRTAGNFSQPLIQSQRPMNNIHGQNQLSHQSKATITTAGTAVATTTTATTTSTSSRPFEQMKFVTQHFNGNSQVKEADYQNNEANIQQLVATLTTSIHPSTSDNGQSKINAEDQVGVSNELKQQQQTKRTYRFHNYDGNMITNHLYSSNHDKQLSQQQPSTANSANNNNNNGNKQHQHHLQRGQQQPIQASGAGSNQISSQRSRQNSLSSTCSTTSSSSSSLISLSNASPLVSVPLVKSPNHENSNSTSSSMSAQCMIEEEAVEAAKVAVAAGGRN